MPSRYANGPAPRDRYRWWNWNRISRRYIGWRQFYARKQERGNARHDVEGIRWSEASNVEDTVDIERGAQSTYYGKRTSRDFALLPLHNMRWGKPVDQQIWPQDPPPGTRMI